MAIDTSVYSKNEFRFAIALESAFGTAINGTANSANFNELFLTEPTQIDYGNVVRDQHKRTDGKLVLSPEDVYVSKAGSDYTVQVNGIATDNTLDLLLHSVMQSLSSEPTASPNLKTWAWDNSTSIGTTASQVTFTLLGYNPATNESWNLPGAVLRELTLNVDPGTNGGRLSYSGTFYSGFAPTQSSAVLTTPGNWTSGINDFYVIQALQTKGLGGTTNNLVLGAFSMTFNNQVTRIGHNASGDAEAYAIGTGGDGLSVTGELKAKYDTTTKDEIDTFLTTPDGGSAEKKLYILWGDGSSDGTLSFDINAIYTGNSLDFGNESGVFVNLPFQGVDDGTNEAIEILLANAIDRGWGS